MYGVLLSYTYQVITRRNPMRVTPRYWLEISSPRSHGYHEILGTIKNFMCLKALFYFLIGIFFFTPKKTLHGAGSSFILLLKLKALLWYYCKSTFFLGSKNHGSSSFSQKLKSWQFCFQDFLFFLKFFL